MISWESPFRSYFMGGFECAYALLKHGERLDLLSSTCHDIRCRTDYRLLKELGIYTVREGLAWFEIDKGSGKYDFSRFENMMDIARLEGIEQIWSLNHFDYPERLNPLKREDEFVDAFTSYGAEAVRTIRKHTSDTIYLIPFNEISFYAFMGGHVGGWAPFVEGGEPDGTKLKKALCRATIEVIKAIWKADQNVRFIHVDPIFRRVPKPPVTPGKQAILAEFNEVCFDCFDMISGKKYPELGGNPAYLDIIGANYYISNQEWILTDDPDEDTRMREPIPWDHPARISLADMLEEMYDRYGRPMVLTETGSYGSLRAQWCERTFKEVDEAIQRGIPLWGICAYPIIDRPDWGAETLTNSGLWDFHPDDPTCERIPHKISISCVKRFIRNLESSHPEITERPATRRTTLPLVPGGSPSVGNPLSAT
jgi:beta-glucosidase/6-phospho-beta-glucosidase/beta-galactosidase